MHALALDNSHSFQTIDSADLALVAGAFSFGDAVRAGNEAAPLGGEAGKNLGPLVGTTVGAIGGGMAGGPLGALAGGTAGYKVGEHYGEGIGRGVGWLGGFGSSVWNQLRGN